MSIDPQYRFKKMWDRNTEELARTLLDAEEALMKVVPDRELSKRLFYTLLAGCDAYFETRRRKEGLDSIQEIMTRLNRVELALEE